MRKKWIAMLLLAATVFCLTPTNAFAAQKAASRRYHVNLTTKVNASKLGEVKKGSSILVVEPEDYSQKELRTMQKKGYTVLGYLSIGTLSTERSWYKKYKKYRRDRLDNWPREYYMDMRKSAWQKFLVSRAKQLRKTGYDGYWLDNLDVYEAYRSNAEFKACSAVLKSIKRVGGYVMVNGGSGFWEAALDRKVKLSSLVNGVTQEEVFSQIRNYSGRGRFGKQSADLRKYYQGLLGRLLKSRVQTYLLEYARNGKMKKQVAKYCKNKQITGYYISNRVNL